jgi:hypothetical protein
MTDYRRRFTPEARPFFGVLYLPFQEFHDFRHLEGIDGLVIRQQRDNMDTFVQVWTKDNEWKTIVQADVVFSQDGVGWEVLAYEDFVLVYEQLGA